MIIFQPFIPTYIIMWYLLGYTNNYSNRKKAITDDKKKLQKNTKDVKKSLKSKCLTRT